MYDSFSQDYDRFVNWEARLQAEMPFIEQQLGNLIGTRSSLRLLDAACGTGMHAIALARHGYRVAGADLSSAMVERARLNAAAAAAEVRFETAGFGVLQQTFGMDSFDAILCLGNSLPHVLTPQALDETLADFAACLHPGGLLLVQNRNFEVVLARRERWMEPQAHFEEGQEWLFLRFYDFEPDGFLTFNLVTLRRGQGLGWSQRVAATSLWPWRQAELETALEKAGFRDITWYGDMTGSPFDSGKSPDLVFVAYKGGKQGDRITPRSLGWAIMCLSRLKENEV